jgi:hypothetical protein
LIDGPALHDPPAPAAGEDAPPSAARRIADWVVPMNPARRIYGMIAIGALLAAESGRHESYVDTIFSAILAALLYWLAHAYSDALGQRLITAERLSASGLWRALVDEWAIVKGAAVPLTALIISWALGAEQETAVTIALWTAVGSVIALELAAGIRSRATPLELALQLAAGASMGIAIFAMKILLD